MLYIISYKIYNFSAKRKYCSYFWSSRVQTRQSGGLRRLKLYRRRSYAKRVLLACRGTATVLQDRALRRRIGERLGRMERCQGAI